MSPLMKRYLRLGERYREDSKAATFTVGRKRSQLTVSERSGGFPFLQGSAFACASFRNESCSNTVNPVPIENGDRYRDSFAIVEGTRARSSR